MAFGPLTSRISVERDFKEKEISKWNGNVLRNTHMYYLFQSLYHQGHIVVVLIRYVIDPGIDPVSWVNRKPVSFWLFLWYFFKQFPTKFNTLLKILDIWPWTISPCITCSKSPAGTTRSLIFYCTDSPHVSPINRFWQIINIDRFLSSKISFRFSSVYITIQALIR